MDKGLVRVGDTGSGHDVYPATNAIEGASKTTLEGRAVVRVGDALAPHVHSRAASQGSSKVTIEGKQACRLGDAINCGGVFITASSKMTIG